MCIPTMYFSCKDLEKFENVNGYSVNRRTDYTMAKKKGESDNGRQNIYIEI